MEEGFTRSKATLIGRLNGYVLEAHSSLTFQFTIDLISCAASDLGSLLIASSLFSFFPFLQILPSVHMHRCPPLTFAL